MAKRGGGVELGPAAPLTAGPGIINITAGLRNIRSTTRRGGPLDADKFVIDVKVGDLFVNLDPVHYAGTVAQQLAQVITSNLLQGAAPDGSPNPQISPATAERRLYRLAQAARGGQIHPKYRDAKMRAQSRRAWNSRFKATGILGGKSDPTDNPAPGTFGIESGLLVRSIAAEPIGDGSSWRIFFANIRGIADRSGRSAVAPG